jgi:hypothetical protein
VPDAIKHLSITLPSPLPFDGIAFEPRQSMRYRSNIDAAKLTRAAQEELASHDRPVFLDFRSPWARARAGSRSTGSSGAHPTGTTT